MTQKRTDSRPADPGAVGGWDESDSAELNPPGRAAGRGNPANGPDTSRRWQGKASPGPHPGPEQPSVPPQPDLAAPLAWILRISGPAGRRLQILA